MSNLLLSDDLLEREFSIAWNAASRILSKQSKTFHVDDKTLQRIIGLLPERETAITSSDQVKCRRSLEDFWCKIRAEVCKSDYRLAIRETTSRGQSVFALTDIPKNSFIGTYEGYIVSAFRLRSELGENAKYVVPISGKDGYFVDPTLFTNHLLPAMRINEPPPGCSTNCRWVRRKYKAPEIWSSKEIKKGEELFIYYGDAFCRDYEIATGLKFECYDEHEEELKRKYPFLSVKE